MDSTKASRRDNGKQIARLRKMCTALPGTSEKLSHGEPTFFVNKRVYAMFSNNHHNDGHIAVWIPAPPGMQESLIEEAPQVYYRPPYVGVKGWVGIELAKVTDEILKAHLQQAWKMLAPTKVPPAGGKTSPSRPRRRSAK